MTEPAPTKQDGMFWRQEHLSPLPIPTGQPASDPMNIIWRKNPVYLDIGSFAMAAGWLTLHMGTVLILVILMWRLLNNDYLMTGAVLLIMGGG